MAAVIPPDVRALLATPVFAHVATVNPDGSPQVSVVWIDLEGDHIVFSTAEGRVKPRNLRRDPRIALSFTPIDQEYRNVTITGTARLEQRGYDLIDRLAAKYLGEERYAWARPGEVRVDVLITPVKVSG